MVNSLSAKVIAPGGCATDNSLLNYKK